MGWFLCCDYFVDILTLIFYIYIYIYICAGLDVHQLLLVEVLGSLIRISIKEKMDDRNLMTFKIILTVLPYDLRVYMYFLCKDLYTFMPFEWNIITHECDKSGKERSIWKKYRLFERF